MKIGILTMFYNSSNYGGILQAYALSRAIKALGLDVEQICYNHYSAWSIKHRIKLKIIKYSPLAKNPAMIGLQIKIHNRTRKVIKASNKLVPHSSDVYNERNIKKCLPNYSAFVTGSDQVWHGDWPAYFLGFVPSEYKKVAYAVSTGKSLLSEKDLERIKKYTDDFYAISVREETTEKQLSVYLREKRIDLVLDPTLLLGREEWEEVASPRLYDFPYIFCYFLGADQKMRSLAEQYGKIHKLCVVTIPHMQGRIERADLTFGDKQCFDVSPQDFLSLIKYADIVFTDSFHASVFSQLFRTKYIAFGRTDHKEMNSRLTTLTEFFETKNRFICEEEKYDMAYIDSIDDDIYSVSDEFLKLRSKSLDFLNKCLDEKNDDKACL